MTFLGLITEIIVEETNDKPIKQKLLDLIGHLGPVKAAKYVGGIKNLVDITYGGDTKKFSDETNTKIRISNDGMNMYFPDTLVQLLGFEDIDGSGKEKKLGNFTYKKEGMKFRFNGRLMKTSFSDKPTEWRVVGTGGSYGIGYGFLTKKETFGIRTRRQIFKDIIDKLNLEPYIKK
jgi:hypothetical protein